MKRFFVKLTLIVFCVQLFVPFALSSVMAQNPDKRIAVLDLSGQGISQAEAKTLTDRLRSHLVRTGVFTVLERDQMDEILQEQGFQQSGCVSDECLVEIGLLIGVQRMVGGSIGKIGQTYTLDLRIIDVSTGRIEKTVSEDYRGERDGLLDVLRVAAERIANKKIERNSSGIAWYYLVGAGVIAAGVAILAAGGSSDSGKNSELPGIGDISWPPSN